MRMQEQQIEEFWEAHPSWEFPLGGFDGDYEGYFRRYDASRYQAHTLRCLDAIDFAEKRFREFGLDQGADCEQIIRSGVIESGLDLTIESVDRIRRTARPGL